MPRLRSFIPSWWKRSRRSTARRRRACACAAAACLAASWGAVAAAQPAAGQGRIVYELGFFAESRPETAYDMVARVPGFAIIEVEEEVRGFSGALGNVLFDGRPPSSKQESLEALLRRIPAASVERIELVRRGAAGLETNGFELVVNVVRRSDGAATSLSAEAGAALGRSDRLRPQLQADLTRRWGAQRLEAALGLRSELDEESGQGRLESFDSGGRLIEREGRIEQEIESTFSSSLEYARPAWGGELTLNGSVEREQTRERIDELEADGEREQSLERETLWSGEAALAYRRELGGGASLDALALHRRGRLRLVETEEDERFSERSRTSETIARLQYRHQRGAFTLEGTAEAARNTLSSLAALEEDGLPIELPGAAAAVEETRAESGLRLAWQAGSGASLEAGLRAEASWLRSRGTDVQALGLFYWKPRLAAGLPLGPGRLSAMLVREAGQLDFRDFVASASLDRGDVSAGAAGLRPSRAWSASLGYELRFWSEGAISLLYRRDWIEDAIDRVAVSVDGALFDAVGNIGDGSRQVLEAELALPLARFGLVGARLQGKLVLRRSRVTDPVTGARRTISEEAPAEGELRFTHDLGGGRWSWGAELVLGERERLFRFDEVRREGEGVLLGAHVEFRPSTFWRLRLEVANLTGRVIAERRDRYDGLRSERPLDEVERLRIATGPLIRLSVRRAFGGASD